MRLHLQNGPIFGKLLTFYMFDSEVPKDIVVNNTLCYLSKVLFLLLTLFPTNVSDTDVSRLCILIQHYNLQQYYYILPAS